MRMITKINPGSGLAFLISVSIVASGVRRLVTRRLPLLIA
jgi:hypothetical protein